MGAREVGGGLSDHIKVLRVLLAPDCVVVVKGGGGRGGGKRRELATHLLSRAAIQ